MIELLTIDAPVEGEPGKVFSTAPKVAIGRNGKTYYIKGRNDPIAFSEVVGCRLAALAGLKVPNAGVGVFEGDLYAAVESVPDAQRSIRPWLKEPQRIDNPSHLFEVTAVDTWLVNDDRNMGNVIGSSVGEGRIEVYMIDFEKSRALGDNPFMNSGGVEPGRLLPTGELGAILRKSRPAQCPPSIVRRIGTVSLEDVRSAVLPVAEQLPFVSWHESSIGLLMRRAEKIGELLEAVWAKS